VVPYTERTVHSRVVRRRVDESIALETSAVLQLKHRRHLPQIAERHIAVPFGAAPDRRVDDARERGRPVRRHIGKRRERKAAEAIWSDVVGVAIEHHIGRKLDAMERATVLRVELSLMERLPRPPPGRATR